MSDLTKTYTTVTGFTGNIRQVAGTRPTDSDAAGLAAGDMYLDTTNLKLGIYSGSQWVETHLTTTSTSTTTS